MTWLLDTNVLSELRRPRPERKVVTFVAAQPLESLYVSTVRFAEIRFGIDLVGDASRRAALHGWLTHRVRPMFRQRVLEVTEDIMFKWRLLVEDGRRGVGVQPVDRGGTVTEMIARPRRSLQSRHPSHRRAGNGPATISGSGSSKDEDGSP